MCHSVSWIIRAGELTGALQVVVSRKCQVDTDSPMQMSSVDEEEDVSPEKKGEV